jgi:hypothetical protein
MRADRKNNAIFLAIFLAGVPSPNPYLKILIESIRSNNYTNVDSYWDQYVTSIRGDKLFSENVENFWGLDGIKEHEVKLAEWQMTEAEFCHQIGLQFTGQAMARESNWFLNKAESLGFVNTATYFARADNYADEWNDILHYNEDLADTNLKVYEAKWRESLIKVIETSKDSNDIYEAHLAITCIYSPARNSLYIDSFAPMTIKNLEKFINDYPSNPLIESAYERLVWWLSTAKIYSKLAGVCKSFLTKYPDSPIAEYIKFQLGNAYYFTGASKEAKRAYLSIDKTSLPDFVYPGWAGQYIIEDLESKLIELEDKN